MTTSVPSDETEHPRLELEDIEAVDLVQRIDGFIRSSSRFCSLPNELTKASAPNAAPSSDSFEGLAQAAFHFQYQRVPPFQRLCDHRRVTPKTLAPFDWRQIPAVPVMAFRRQKLHAAQVREVFRSSGTTGGQAERSVHLHPFPDLYRTVIEATFPIACLPASDRENRRSILSLVPSRRTVQDSSLGFMCEHILERFGNDDSAVAMGSEGLQMDVVNAWYDNLNGQPGTVLATAFALAFWLDALEERDLKISLPEGSTLFETGGFKGRTRELARDELLERVQERLGLRPDAVIREYGMTELTGHFYTDVLAGGDPDRFTVPPFMKVRMLEPTSLQEVPDGEPGLVSLLDLSNIGSAMHVITQDLGTLDCDPEHGPGFWLLGRASDSQLRGCSLTAEELSSPSVL